MTKRATRGSVVLIGEAQFTNLRVVRSVHGNFYLEQAWRDAMGVRSWRPYKIETADRMLDALGDLAYAGVIRRRATKRRKAKRP